jgi:hypothetical protein
MTRVNQNDDPVEETLMFQCWSDAATSQERDTAIGLILEHLGMEIVRTNATKHGNVELELRKAS